MSGSQGERIQRTSDALTANLGDSLLMMSVARGQYFSLNGVATRIWDLLENPTTPSILIRQLVAEYEVSAEACASQVEPFLAALRERDLLGDAA